MRKIILTIIVSKWESAKKGMHILGRKNYK
jgi:hypothetical protein